MGFASSAMYLWYSYEMSWSRELTSINLAVAGCIFIFVSLIMIVYWHMLLEIKINTYKKRLVHYELYDISKELDEDIYETSIKMSYKYLDEYYLQTRSQAQKGFYVTVGVAIGGALLIGVGIVAMFTNATSPAYVTTASGVIIEFIAAVFFHLYNRTIQSMNSYHDKLVLSQNISVALKLSESISKSESDKAKMDIIHELIKDINLHIKNDSQKTDK